tara:strand:- start:35035 stop:35886 length:852 start_codon:yes stop_codon:yes gene_type:complete
MKALPFKIPKPENSALIYQIDSGSFFYDQLHQHAEIQISFIEKGEGTLVVGDSINDYQSNDIVVIGGYVPHVFRSDTEAANESKMYSLFFDRTSFGDNFFELPDTKSTNRFFKATEYGIKVLSQKKKIIKKFKKLEKQNKFERVVTLLQIIGIINKSKTTALSSFLYKRKYSDNEGKRMTAVFKYTMEKYNEPISLETISGIANMSKNAFCRYFKKRTNKTFFQFLIELRVENACKLLSNHQDLAISTISEQCGFQNTSNFNRKFKAIKGGTPSQYRLKRFNG